MKYSPHVLKVIFLLVFNFSSIIAQSNLEKAISLFDENKYEEAKNILEDLIR